MRIVLRALVVLGLSLSAGCYAVGDAPGGSLDAGAYEASLPDATLALDAGLDADGDVDADMLVDAGDTVYCTAFASEVVDHAFGTGQSHNQTAGFPGAVFGPPFANEVSQVVSLGNGGYVVLAFGEHDIVDGPGADFLVFENPLPNFVELATVSVSIDAVTWHELPCTAAQSATEYGPCAGVRRVLSSPRNGISPFDPDLAGGDAYDLADFGIPRARYVRIVDRVDLDGAAGVFDLDAVSVRHASCTRP